MIQKIQTLQRRLIQKTEEVVEKELLIQVRAEYITYLTGISFFFFSVRGIHLLGIVLHGFIQNAETYKQT